MLEVKGLVPTMLMAAALLAVAACNGQSGAANSGGGGDGGGGGGGGDGGNNPVVQTHVNLFDCGLTFTCGQVYAHIGWENGQCAAKQMALSETGVIDLLDDPGGACSQTNTIFVLLGDGTLLRQRRERHSSKDFCSNEPWEASSAQFACTIHVKDGALQLCQNDDLTCEYPYNVYEDECTEVEDWTCDQVKAAVGQ